MIESVNNIKYKLLDTGRAFIITREPMIADRLVYFEFIDAPEGCTAIFEHEDKQIYRKLDENKSCSISADKINGVVKVTVMLLDGSAHTEKWSCEQLYVKKSKGTTLISPNVFDMPKHIAELAAENESMRKINATLIVELSEASARIKTLESKVIKLQNIFDTNSLNFLIK